MYRLTFKQNQSKYFPEALSYAQELGGTYKNGIVTIELTDILSAYAQIRTLFAFIQNWKGTHATFNNKPVHPYQFLLHAHHTSDCYTQRLIDNDCGNEWGCLRIDNLRYQIPHKPFKTHKYWYQYGYYSGQKWIIDKKKIYDILLNYAQEKGITACPFFQEIKLKASVENLPNYIIPDNVTFGVTYLEQYYQGEKIQIPSNILHLTKTN